MNWSKIKSIMIFFLIGINIFLLLFLSITTYQRSVVPPEVIDASLKVMEKEGFSCEKQLFPSNKYSLPTLSATFLPASALSDMFFGRQLAFRTDGTSLIAREDEATLTLTDNSFIYKSGYDASEDFSPKQIKKALEKAGLDMSSSRYSKRDGVFYYEFKDIILSDVYIKASLDSDGEISSVEAYWPSQIRALEKQPVSFTQVIMDLKEAFPEGGKITKIESVYYLRAENTSGKHLFYPAWRVTVDRESKIIN